MSLRSSIVLVVSCLACAGEGRVSRLESESTPPGSAGDVGQTRGSDDTVQQVPPLCPASAPCTAEFALELEASEPWPLGRYFLRVGLDRRPPIVCEIAFEPVVGAVTDTCNGQDREFRVAYRYDDAVRAIERLTFGIVGRVDMEIRVAEDRAPLVEVHHDVLVQKCSYSCSRAAPLLVRVEVGAAAAPPSVDGGNVDAGQGSLDAAINSEP